MSQDQIHEVAQRDTPQAVTVPNNMTGLLMWAAGRWGGGAVMAIIVVVGITKIYTDMQVQTAQSLGDQKAQAAVILEMVRDQSKSQADVAISLKEVSKALESNTRAIEDAHRRAGDGR